MNTVTLADLKAAHACYIQVRLFQQTFGESAEVTEANLAKAVKAGLQIEWLERLVPDARRPAFIAAIADAWRVYDAAGAFAKQACSDAIDTAYKAYRNERADQAYDEAKALADRVQNDALVIADQAFDDAITLALVVAFS